MKKKVTTVSADAWLDRLVHRSRDVQSKVDDELAAITARTRSGSVKPEESPHACEPLSTNDPEWIPPSLDPYAGLMLT
jgi:hypothetical protein